MLINDMLIEKIVMINYSKYSTFGIKTQKNPLQPSQSQDSQITIGRFFQQFHGITPEHRS